MNLRRLSVLPAASVLGVGAMTPLGCDLETIAQKLAEPPIGAGEPLRVADETLSDPRIGRRMRRADRFLKMAVLASLNAWTAAENACGKLDGNRVGVIVATGLGPHARMFRFLDGILDFGDTSALPIDFSHSVHNAAGAYITELLDLRGRSFTITDFEAAFEQAVLLAQCWLAQGACSYVLLGGVEELGDVMLRFTTRTLAECGKSGAIVPGEGAVFLALGPAGIAGCVQIDATNDCNDVDMLIIDAPELFAASADETISASETGQLATFSTHFGHQAGGSAMQVLGGLLSLQHGRGLGRVISGGGRAVNSVATRKRLSNGRTATLVLRNPVTRPANL